jgi:cytochrome c-type biogenesis protein CcmH/NrfG
VTTLIACAALTLALALYVFYPEKRVTAQRGKSRLEYLEERKTVLYDNLRDLNFERAAGKYTDEEFHSEQAVLEGEAATVVTEMDALGH